MNSKETYAVYVKSIRHEADNVLSFELLPEAGCNLPAFTAGAHIDLIIPEIPIRSYSLLNSQADINRYEIAVSKDPKSRGGSKLIHERIRCGDRFKISEPRNLFPLHEQITKSVLIAGGIGITPLWSMAQRLESLGAEWELHYFARDRESAALLDRMDKTFSFGRVRVYLASEVQQVTSTIVDVVGGHNGTQHYYCCGPAGMLESFKMLSANLPLDCVHYESFVPLQEASIDGGFEVLLARSGTTVVVDPGQSILEALTQVGVEVMNSCKEGICGACEVVVLDGEPDHRDSILSESERANNKSMFVCCSGSNSPRLVLDL